MLNLFRLCFLLGRDFCSPVLWLLKTHTYCSIKVYFTCHKASYFKCLTGRSLVILSSDATITIIQIQDIFFPWIRFYIWLIPTSTISQTIVYILVYVAPFGHFRWNCTLYDLSGFFYSANYFEVHSWYTIHSIMLRSSIPFSIFVVVDMPTQW